MAGSQRKTSARFALSWIFIALALTAIIAAALLAAGSSSQEKHLKTLENRIETLRRLSTVNQMYRSVIYVEEKNFWRGNKQLLFTLEYNVVAGVDFSKGIEIRALSNGSVEVRMPRAEVFSWDADETTIHQLFLREAPLFNPILLGDYMPQLIVEGEKNRQSALDNGILDRAEANARMAIVKVLELGKTGPVVFGPPITGPAAGAQDAERDDDGS